MFKPAYIETRGPLRILTAHLRTWELSHTALHSFIETPDEAVILLEWEGRIESSDPLVAWAHATRYARNN